MSGSAGGWARRAPSRAPSAQAACGAGGGEGGRGAAGALGRPRSHAGASPPGRPCLRANKAPRGLGFRCSTSCGLPLYPKRSEGLGRGRRSSWSFPLGSRHGLLLGFQSCVLSAPPPRPGPRAAWTGIECREGLRS